METAFPYHFHKSLDIRKSFFTEGGVECKNSLSKDLVMVPSLSERKKLLDEALSYMV